MDPLRSCKKNCTLTLTNMFHNTFLIRVLKFDLSSGSQRSSKLAFMDVERVLRMKEGLGKASYAKSSSLQKKSMESLKHIVIESATDFYLSETPGTLTMVDLGCSSGPNTLSMLGSIIQAINRCCHEASKPPPEFMVFLNDLPTNDFNTVFATVPEFVRELNDSCKNNGCSIPSVCMAGVPGNFYGRLFPTNSLHFISSCYSLHWLSQVSYHKLSL